LSEKAIWSEWRTFQGVAPMSLTIRAWSDLQRICLVCLVVLTAAHATSIRLVQEASGEPVPGQDQGAIFGKIVDDAGMPVARARIGLWRQVPKYRFISDGSPVMSDAQGNFRFSILRDAHYRLVVEKDGFARAFRGETIEDHQQIQTKVVVKRPATGVIELKDEAGQPIVGAQVREYRLRGPNGPPYFPGLWLATFGIKIAPSDAAGRLSLPPLPEGEIGTFTIDHAQFAPIRVADVTITSGVIAQATMHPGISLTVHFSTKTAGEKVSRITINLSEETGESPSAMRLCAIPVDKNGISTVTIEPGAYQRLVLEHDDYFVTPYFEPRGRKRHVLPIRPRENDDLWFQFRRKVTARGRVINVATGQPMQNVWVEGEISNDPVPGKPAIPPEPWVHSDGGNTDSNGEYTLAFAAGRARVSFSEHNFVAEHDYVEFAVAADGSTVIPEIRVRPMPKIAGVVRNPDGSLATRAVVRLRGQYLRWTQPMVTDDAGRFELQAPWIPIDEREQRLPIQPLVVFDPLRPLAARANVRLDEPGAIELKLEPHEPRWLLAAFSEEMTDWERGSVPKDQADKDAAISLRGQRPPELEGMAWLNTDKRAPTLADFGGKYILLDFWFTSCGPCHREFPAVKLIHELYKDDVVVIGVHNNSALPGAVREHAAKVGLTFPIVIDHPDGRIVSRYQKHGLVPHYPSYVLIGPDGNVLLDDMTIANPKLSSYKLEILHDYLLSRTAPGQ
jgi:thiol-disulfide isomerase/thioredoxin